MQLKNYGTASRWKKVVIGTLLYFRKNMPSHVKNKHLWFGIQKELGRTGVALASPLDCKEIQLVHSERDQPWDFFGRNDAKAETPVLWWPHAKSWLIGKDSNAGRDWGWDGWMASLTRWTWVWVNSRSWWWTGRPGVLWFMGSQRVGHDWATELKWFLFCLN